MKGEALLILVLIIVGMFAVGAYFVYKATHIPWLPWLSEEIGSKPVLAQMTFDTLEPGIVLVVNGTEKGWTIVEKNTQLYDKLELDNIDLSIGDIIAPHLYNWYFPRDYALHYIMYNTSIGVGNKTVIEFIVRNEKPLTVDNNATYLLWVEAAQWRFGYHGYGSDRLEFGVWNSSNAYKTPLSISFEEEPGWWNWTVVKTEDMFKLYVNGTLEQTNNLSDVLRQPGNIYIKSSGYDTDWLVSFIRINKTIFDATFFNGSHYFELSRPVVGTPADVERMPAPSWLWHIKDIANDGKLHFRWFPEGSIIRIKDGYGNVVREFIIKGEKAGSTNQVLDYAISLDSTTIPGASIEAWIPSNKIRVYAPLGAEVRVVDENNVTVGSGVVSGSNYVDIALAGPVKNAVIEVVAPNGEDENVVVETKQLDDGSIRIKVMDDNGVLLPGMLVRVADPSNYIVYANVTGQDGTVTFKPSRPLPEATIEVSGIWSGRLVYTTKTVTLAAAVTSAAATENNNQRYELLALGIGILVIAGLIVAVTRR